MLTFLGTKEMWLKSFYLLYLLLPPFQSQQNIVMQNISLCHSHICGAASKIKQQLNAKSSSGNFIMKIFYSMIIKIIKIFMSKERSYFATENCF